MKVKNCKMDGTLYVYDKIYIVRFTRFNPEIHEDEAPYRMQYIRVRHDGRLTGIYHAGLCADDEVYVLYTKVE